MDDERFPSIRDKFFGALISGLPFPRVSPCLFGVYGQALSFMGHINTN
jgi:hypothetical protein